MKKSIAAISISGFLLFMAGTAFAAGDNCTAREYPNLECIGSHCPPGYYCGTLPSPPDDQGGRTCCFKETNTN